MTLFTDPTPKIETKARQAFAVIDSIPETSESADLGIVARAKFKGSVRTVSAIGDGVATGDRGHFVESGKKAWFIKAGSFYHSNFAKSLKEWLKRYPASSAIMQLMKRNKKKYDYKTGIIVSVAENSASVKLDGETKTWTMPTKFEADAVSLTESDVGKRCLVFFDASGSPSVVAQSSALVFENRAAFATGLFDLDALSPDTYILPTLYPGTNWDLVKAIRSAMTDAGGRTVNLSSGKFYPAYNGVGISVVPKGSQIIKKIRLRLMVYGFGYDSADPTEAGTRDVTFYNFIKASGSVSATVTEKSYSRSPIIETDGFRSILSFSEYEIIPPETPGWFYFAVNTPSGYPPTVPHYDMALLKGEGKKENSSLSIRCGDLPPYNPVKEDVSIYVEYIEP